MNIKNLSIDSLTLDDKESVTGLKNFKKSQAMALYVKYPKTCRNKKQSAAFLTPPDSPLSSSSGSLSSGNSGHSERKQHPKRKPLRYKGHTTTLIAIPKQKKLKTKKSSPSMTASGSDSDCLQQHQQQQQRNNNSLDEMNRNALYSLCKIFFRICY